MEAPSTVFVNRQTGVRFKNGQVVPEDTAKWQRKTHSRLPKRSAFELVKMYCHATTQDADSLLHASLRPKLRYWSVKCGVAGQIRKLSCPHKYVCVRSRCPSARVNLRLDCIRLQLCATLRSEYSLLVGDPQSVYFYRGIAFFTTLGTRFQRFCCICL